MPTTDWSPYQICDTPSLRPITKILNTLYVRILFCILWMIHDFMRQFGSHFVSVGETEHHLPRALWNAQVPRAKLEYQTSDLCPPFISAWQSAGVTFSKQKQHHLYHLPAWARKSRITARCLSGNHLVCRSVLAAGTTASCRRWRATNASATGETASVRNADWSLNDSGSWPPR